MSIDEIHCLFRLAGLPIIRSLNVIVDPAFFDHHYMVKTELGWIEWTDRSRDGKMVIHINWSETGIARTMHPESGRTKRDGVYFEGTIENIHGTAISYLRRLKNPPPEEHREYCRDEMAAKGDKILPKSCMLCGISSHCQFTES